MSFTDFFRTASGYPPLPYQAALAEGPLPEVLDVPTGMGKTAAAVLPFLFRQPGDQRRIPHRTVPVVRQADISA